MFETMRQQHKAHALRIRLDHRLVHYSEQSLFPVPLQQDRLFQGGLCGCEWSGETLNYNKPNAARTDD